LENNLGISITTYGTPIIKENVLHVGLSDLVIREK
jgi:hypothetical protein